MHTFENGHPIPVCMKDGTKLILGIVAGIALMLIGVALLIWFDMSLWMFLAMNAVGTALIILPIASIDGDWVSLEEDGIRIDAPFVDLRIPFRSIIVVVGLVAVTMTTGHAGAYLRDDALVIDATGMKKTVGFDEIAGVELRYDMDYGKRVGGTANSKILTGSFRNDEFGMYHLAVNRGVDACIVVFTEGKTKVFNLESDTETGEFFHELESRLPPRTAGFIASPYQCTARCRRRRMSAPQRSGSVRGSWGSAPWRDGTSIRSNPWSTVRRASSPGRGAWSSWGFRCTFR